LADDPAPRPPIIRAPASGEGAVVVRLPSLHDPATVAVLCQGLAMRLVTAGADRVRCDVTAADAVDLGTVDALARMALTAKRSGASLTVQGAAGDLVGLLGLAGLSAVVSCEDDPAG